MALKDARHEFNDTNWVKPSIACRKNAEKYQNMIGLHTEWKQIWRQFLEGICLSKYFCVYLSTYFSKLQQLEVRSFLVSKKVWLWIFIFLDVSKSPKTFVLFDSCILFFYPSHSNLLIGHYSTHILILQCNVTING